MKKAKKPIRLGVAYAFQIAKYGYPPSFEDLDQGLRDLSRLGFRYTELEGLGKGWNRHFARHRKRYCSMLSDLGIHIYNYCIVDPSLVSLDKAKRKKAYELYDEGCENAAAFGAESIHLASYAPPLKFSRRPYKLGEEYNFNLDYRPMLPAGFDWKACWGAVVDSCRRACETAAKYKLNVLMEPRVGEVICNSESMLMLLKEVDHPRLKANFDFAHFVAQKEILPLSWAKLEKHVGGIHIADNNSKDVEHRQIGQGIIDFETILQLIAQSNYVGYMGLDFFVSKRNVDRAFVEGRRLFTDRVRESGLGKRFEV
ncbi:MAG: sugar phosphate isomerase/epimerase [Phycisphaerales bacterium]|jgi:sugar phosphate isomerase/epimerase|nr:sugar phosphate isomerase/epimerase [Phycisphaerales bacterium]